MEKRIKLVAAHQKFLADAKALVDGADTDLTEEQQTQFDSLIAGAEKTKRKLKTTTSWLECRPRRTRWSKHRHWAGR